MGLLKTIKIITNYKNKFRKQTIKQILLAGGWGYGNTGDEAQCNAAYKLLKKRYPDYQIKLLTPNPDYSFKLHNANCEYASRVAIFDENRDNDCFRFEYVERYKNEFIKRSRLMVMNAYLMRANLPVIGINSSQARFLQLLKESSLFFFGGGGYLTGSTISRLWDGMLVCKLCEILKTPVVMSGQTIGVWNTEENKKIAKIGFKNVKAIALRDKVASKKDLEEIGITENIFIGPDDGLFCEKSKEKIIQDENYITLNFHYWGMNDEDKIINIEKIHKIVSYICQNTDYNIVFIPMHNTDEQSYFDYIEKHDEFKNRIKMYQYDYDFRKIRRVIADSKLCITMKHHPIIFAMGEKIPCISIAFSSYYEHKNKGALEEYGQEKYSVVLSNDDYFDCFIDLFCNIDRESIICEISKKLTSLALAKEKFMFEVDIILTKLKGNL